MLGVSPLEHYLRGGYIESWMIYRLMVCLLLGAGGYTLLCTGVVADDLLFLIRPAGYRKGFANHMLKKVLSGRACWSWRCCSR